MESVYVVERRVLDEHFGFYPHGFLSLGDDETRLRLAHSLPEGFFVQREIAEHRPDWKQIIPYVLLRNHDFIWLMRRETTGDEKRLHGMQYVGVGGHINPEDDDDLAGHPCWESAMTREFIEEASIWKDGHRFLDPHALGARIVGIINDDSNEVGAVHLGLVYEVEVPDGCEIATEDEGRWVHVREAQCMDTGKFETWTRLILDGISK